MNSVDFYKILHVWDVSNIESGRVRRCQVILKMNESLSDMLLVEYADGKRDRVNGKYLMTSREKALQYIEEIRIREVNDLMNKKSLIDFQISEVNKKMDNVLVDNDLT